MKWHCESENIVPLLTVLMQTVDKRDPHKSGIKIVVQKGGVDLYTCNVHAGTCATVCDAVVNAPGEIIVDAEKFARSIRCCEGKISFDIKDTNLRIVSDSKQYQLVAHATDKMAFRHQKSFSSISVKKTDLRRALRLCLPAVNTVRADDMKGFSLEVSKKECRVSVIDKKSAAGATVTCKTSSADLAPVIVSKDFATCVLSLKEEEDDKSTIEIGINGGTAAVSHEHGYSYFPLLSGKPVDVNVILKALPECKVLCVAGFLAKAIRSVMIMSDGEEGYKGKLSGEKGKLRVTSWTAESGAAKDEIIVAGDFGNAVWYNIRALLDFISRVEPDQEISLGLMGKDKPALIVKHMTSIYWLASCEPPDDN